MNAGAAGEILVFERFGHLRLLQTTLVTREMALNHIAIACLGLSRSY